MRRRGNFDLAVKLRRFVGILTRSPYRLPLSPSLRFPMYTRTLSPSDADGMMRGIAPSPPLVSLYIYICCYTANRCPR